MNVTLSDRIKRLRTERGWSQTEFAQQLKVHQKQVSGYERNVHVPSTEVLIRMAELFNVSLDYLAFDNREDSRSNGIADRELVQQLAEIDKLSETDKSAVKTVLDTFILKNRLQSLMA